MNGFQYFMGGVYCTECNFGSIKGFSKHVETLLGEVPFEKMAVIDKTLEAIEILEHSPKTISSSALDFLIAQDLRKVATTLQSLEVAEPEISLFSNRDKFIRFYRNLGLSFSEPPLYIVDTFPKPYDVMDWTATSPDLADQKNYGIKPGNYFKRKNLIPYRSDFLLAHEIIHHIIGEVDPNWLGRGLEEGIAIILGELFLGSKVINRNYASIYTEYHWLDHGATQLKQIYTEYARQATAIYKRFGLDGILALIKGGRVKIKQVEEACLDNNWDLIDLPKGSWDAEFNNTLDTLMMGFIRNLVVSPLAFYVAMHTKLGDTLIEISEKSHTTLKEVKEALEEIQQKTFLIVIADDHVDYSDLEMMFRTRTLRYEI